MHLLRKNPVSLIAKPALLLLVLTSAVLIAGCASNVTTIAPRLPDHPRKLGRAEGKACGSMLIGAPAYNFIPVYLNSRVERAYQRALESVPGATALGDVTMQESWYWWVLGSTRCVTITGEAVR